MGGHRRRVNVLAIASTAAAVALAVVLIVQMRASPWKSAGSLSELQADGVRYLIDEHLFVVWDGDSAIALLDGAQHIDDERVLYCPSSGWFQGQHGEMFDRYGFYALGPGSSGLTRVAVRVSDESVEVNPEEIIGTPPRGAHAGHDRDRTNGPFCRSDPLQEVEPGITAP
jgi:hypothetical protein